MAFLHLLAGRVVQGDALQVINNTGLCYHRVIQNAKKVLPTKDCAVVSFEHRISELFRFLTSVLGPWGHISLGHKGEVHTHVDYLHVYIHVFWKSRWLFPLTTVGFFLLSYSCREKQFACDPVMYNVVFQMVNFFILILVCFLSWHFETGCQLAFCIGEWNHLLCQYFTLMYLVQCKLKLITFFFPQQNQLQFCHLFRINTTKCIFFSR